MVTNYKVFTIAKHSINVAGIVNYNSKLPLLHCHRPKKEKNIVIFIPYFSSETKWLKGLLVFLK